jgi:transposase InsO family protein
LRQYFSKGTDLSRWSSEDLEAVALAMNNRPRKVLGWRTQPKSSKNSYAHYNNPVLQRPVESEQYTSADFANACARWKVRQSMGRVGSCFDNAVTEAPFSTITVEYVHRHRFRTRAEGRLKIATWITDFYHRRRRHCVCDGLSPINYERSTARALEVQAA